MSKEIIHALTRLEKNDLIALPTETVYGLAANALCDQAVAKIYALKKRPHFNPLIAHFASMDQAKKYVRFTQEAEVLAKAFWPGPLTLILHKKKNSPLSLLATAGLETLAVRVPAHPLAQKILEGLPFPLVAPSANPSESLSPTTAQHVRAVFPDLFVVDGGPCAVGLESTIVDLTGEKPVILRPGSLTKKDMEKVLSAPFGEKTKAEVIKAPGQLKRHYAPSTSLRLDIKEIKKGETLLSFGHHGFIAQKEINLSPRGDLQEAAAHFFSALAELDVSGCRGIAVMPIPNEGIGVAINDRLNRAVAVPKTP